VCAAAGATVILETDPATQADDIAWLRSQLAVRSPHMETYRD
ncbi:MAG: hypothetical protein QOG46_2038, partial [Pseudonocardiales bacterium]|nr:hypothetical protein [Pseudonocardiales bacterium]